VQHFEAWELVCPHVYRKYGNMSLMFADPRLLRWLAWFREAIDRPVVMNTYLSGGQYSQRGYRCNLCHLVFDNTMDNNMYLSAHTRFQAADFHVQDMTDADVRLWIGEHKDEMPERIRIEMNTSGWVHVDVAVPLHSIDKIIYFV
jgi:hypothetical protein